MYVRGVLHGPRVSSSFRVTGTEVLYYCGTFHIRRLSLYPFVGRSSTLLPSRIRQSRLDDSHLHSALGPQRHPCVGIVAGPSDTLH